MAATYTYAARVMGMRLLESEEDFEALVDVLHTKLPSLDHTNYQLRKRMRDFVELDDAIREQFHYIQVPPVPRTGIIWMQSHSSWPRALNYRQKKLDMESLYLREINGYLQAVMANPEVIKSKVMIDFLKICE